LLIVNRFSWSIAPFFNANYLENVRASYLSSSAESGLNLKALNRCVVTLAVLGVVGILYVLLSYGWRYAAPLIALPLALLVITSPRLALYQFVFFCFIDLPLVPSVPLSLIDLSMLTVVAAGTTDVMLDSKLPQRLPRLSLNYLYIIAVLAICGLFGYWPELAPRRIVTTSLLLLTFLSIYRLSGKAGAGTLVRLYFWLAVAHSVYVLAPFLMHGGAYRSFGFAVSFYDDFAMIALPVGVGLYLGAHQRKSSGYLLGVVAVFGGLIATQVRAALVLAVVASGFVMIVAYLRTRSFDKAAGFSQTVRRRLRRLIVMPAAVIVLALTVAPGLFTAVLERFGELLTAKPSGTTVYRLELWKRALLAFSDHPIFGVGPGGFYRLNSLYESLHLTPNFPYLRGLGAHNPFLHFLAETGIVGGVGLLALIGNHFRTARQSWMARIMIDPVALVLYGLAFLFATSMIIEAGWMWGPASFPGVLMAALAVRHHATAGATPQTD